MQRRGTCHEAGGGISQKNCLEDEGNLAGGEGKKGIPGNGCITCPFKKLGVLQRVWNAERRWVEQWAEMRLPRWAEACPERGLDSILKAMGMQWFLFMN